MNEGTDYPLSPLSEALDSLTMCLSSAFDIAAQMGEQSHGQQTQLDCFQKVWDEGPHPVTVCLLMGS